MSETWTINSVREAIAAKKISAREWPRNITRALRAKWEAERVPDALRRAGIRASGSRGHAGSRGQAAAAARRRANRD